MRNGFFLGISMIILSMTVSSGCWRSTGGGGTSPDADTDVDTDTDTDTDTDADTTCPVHVIGAGGSDDASGSSWEEGLATVEAGLDLAEEHGCDVWVKAGTYLPTEDPDGSSTPADTRSVTFRLRAGVALYGGFAGDELELSERDVAANETILSGDIGTIDDGSDNACHVVTGADGAIIDGFTITSGNADDCEEIGTVGGGMFNRDGASPTVVGCTFSGNSANDSGGGMFNEGASSTVTGCTFSDNSALGSGGGMYNSGNPSPTVTSCTFSGNSAPMGGGMYNNGSSPTVTGCTFSGNSADDLGGGMYNYYDSSPIVAGCTFSGNMAAFDGGGMYNDGSSPTVTDCSFSGNSAGGLSYWHGGGGMYNKVSSPTVTGCTFFGNHADEDGGAMRNYDSASTVTNCILWGDTADSGGNELFDGDLASPVVTYSDVEGGYTGDGNIDIDPLFVSTTDLHLQPTSPCIDTGSNAAVPDDVTTDLDGNPRIVDGNGDSTATVDMGAYEHQP